ncbi:MAG: adenylosuccinate lyase [Legionellales bacterium]|nr:adenylosuccinate lyase [Legionellales bacterium]
MEHSTLTAIAPIDGRYAEHCDALREHTSEHGLIRYRVMVEIHWLITLLEEVVQPTPPLDESSKAALLSIIDNFSFDDSKAIKKIESSTNHDVKAVEYFVKSKIKEMDKPEWAEWVHFACTSEDINNLAYALMLKHVRDEVTLPVLHDITQAIKKKAHDYADMAMMSRTHGQPASPTTMGKELANVVYRLNRQIDQLRDISILGKLNGAVGNFNAHMSAYPETNWIKVARSVVEKLGLHWNPYTTQIEPHDWIAEYFDVTRRVNTILIDFSRDVWGYISLGYFQQKRIKGEVGSSTMPHKVNPIDFENAEGNLGISNALCDHFSHKLPISRFQRDLTDSTVLRNVGAACAYQKIALTALSKGLSKIDPSPTTMLDDLNNNWALLAEPIQTILRKHGVENPYELLKDFSRGEMVTKDTLHQFIDGLPIDPSLKTELKALTPAGYIGAAATLAQHL